jgi:uncharacterized SAM-binding protein YcdF (DUF218 family)
MRGVVWLARALLAAGILWLAGFVGFEHGARRPAKDTPVADGIVALTGGAERIDTALSLLLNGRAPILLISGVGHGAELFGLERRVHLSPEQAARVTLGRVATSTSGNAAETARWAQSHDIHSLIVVTAGYHMPRALLELGRALPGVRLYPVAVQPPALRGGMDMATTRILANEYDKYLAVWLGITRRPDDIMAAPRT